MIVLDACAIVDMVRQTPDGLALQQLMLNDEPAISCDLIRAETASAFRKLARTEGLSASQAERYCSEAIALVDEFYPMAELQTEALRESIRLDHSTYDLFYFILARRTGATLFTLDRKLMALCAAHGVDCVAEVSLRPEPSGHATS
ncbi:MAG: type II toxin-antitoxin system VapC family toxin [Eggerthellaceae bacterium]|nr:type II toxin-antitoxin system VapC family toxin [Eggerthellaceae bacterium]